LTWRWSGWSWHWSGWSEQQAVAGESFADLIEPFSRRGVDLGLDRLQAALAELGHPERRFAAVQVAGTNGKGSIATLVHRSLLAAGIRAGLYTSPHLVCWTERIRIGAEAVAPAALRRHLLHARAVAERGGLTPFELVTAAAFLAFAGAGCELVVRGGAGRPARCHHLPSGSQRDRFCVRGPGSPRVSRSRPGQHRR
jgi:hypothetical protein